MGFVQNFTPYFNIFSDKNTKNEWKWRNLHRWQKFYTAASSDGIDKFHLWPSSHHHQRHKGINYLNGGCRTFSNIVTSDPQRYKSPETEAGEHYYKEISKQWPRKMKARRDILDRLYIVCSPRLSIIIWLSRVDIFIFVMTRISISYFSKFRI